MNLNGHLPLPTPPGPTSLWSRPAPPPPPGDPSPSSRLARSDGSPEDPLSDPSSPRGPPAPEGEPPSPSGVGPGVAASVEAPARPLRGSQGEWPAGVPGEEATAGASRPGGPRKQGSGLADPLGGGRPRAESPAEVADEDADPCGAPGLRGAPLAVPEGPLETPAGALDAPAGHPDGGLSVAREDAERPVEAPHKVLYPGARAPPPRAGPPPPGPPGPPEGPGEPGGSCDEEAADSGVSSQSQTSLNAGEERRREDPEPRSRGPQGAAQGGAPTDGDCRGVAPRPRQPPPSRGPRPVSMVTWRRAATEAPEATAATRTEETPTGETAETAETQARHGAPRRRRRPLSVMGILRLGTEQNKQKRPPPLPDLGPPRVQLRPSKSTPSQLDRMGRRRRHTYGGKAHGSRDAGVAAGDRGSEGSSSEEEEGAEGSLGCPPRYVGGGEQLAVSELLDEGGVVLAEALWTTCLWTRRSSRSRRASCCVSPTRPTAPGGGAAPATPPGGSRPPSSGKATRMARVMGLPRGRGRETPGGGPAVRGGRGGP
ncbi:uncharacterized protein LOC144950145 [Lampetra fluviatilis]